MLAYRLIKRGKKVLLIDNNLSASSSKVAAGIINPITGHRLNITAGFEQFWPIAEAAYAEMETDFGVSFYKPVAQTRLIKNQGQFDYLQQRQQQAEYLALIGEHKMQSPYFMASEFGSIDIKQSAIVDCKELLSACKAWLIERNAYLCTKLDYTNLGSNESGVAYQEIVATSVIFCEGHAATNNPWLNTLPFKLAKGEILSMKLHNSNALDLPLLNWGNWLAPTSTEGVAKLGSSFEWKDLSLKPNAATRDKLLTSLNTNSNIEATLIESEVGIRPTTRDRMPFIGGLKNLKHAYCFNGFGSKGCLLIPYYADLLCDHLIDQQPLPNELTQWL